MLGKKLQSVSKLQEEEDSEGAQKIDIRYAHLDTPSWVYIIIHLGVARCNRCISHTSL